MDIPPKTPPFVRPPRVITYEITRWDLVAGWMTIFLRNRFALALLIFFLMLNLWVNVAPGSTTRPIFLTVFDGVASTVRYVVVLVGGCGILGIANAFLLKQKGVVGQHVLEITGQGLVERTEFNESIHTWASIGRISSIFGYLYIYVGDNNCHHVPKRSFSTEEIDGFEAELRARARQAGA